MSEAVTQMEYPDVAYASHKQSVQSPKSSVPRTESSVRKIESSVTTYQSYLIQSRSILATDHITSARHLHDSIHPNLALDGPSPFLSLHPSLKYLPSLLFIGMLSISVLFIGSDSDHICSLHSVAKLLFTIIKHKIFQRSVISLA